MKRFFFLLSILMALVLVACQGSSPAPEGTETPPPAPTTSEATGIIPTPASEEPAETATPSSYPARPTTSSPESGYPPEELEESAPPPAYPPGEPVWVVRPVGEQCADESAFAYDSLQEAVSALEEAGVTILSSESVALMVCEACGCPTSEHYRVQVSGEDVRTARSLGWTTEE